MELYWLNLQKRWVKVASDLNQGLDSAYETLVHHRIACNSNATSARYEFWTIKCISRWMGIVRHVICAATAGRRQCSARLPFATPLLYKRSRGYLLLCIFFLSCSCLTVSLPLDTLAKETSCFPSTAFRNHLRSLSTVVVNTCLQHQRGNSLLKTSGGCSYTVEIYSP